MTHRKIDSASRTVLLRAKQVSNGNAILDANPTVVNTRFLRRLCLGYAIDTTQSWILFGRQRAGLQAI